ncbi:MAG: DUF2085 domain-containing protein [Holophagales bacterium]|jgi:uncharacterized membrane protein|nr:DUF2085 domain-containing protein [Holophagales bacterium]
MFSIHILYSIRFLTVLLGALPWILVAFDQNPISMLLFKGFCHQIPERTLIICGAPMAVCSRCAGIYAGIAIGAVTPSFGFMSEYGRTAVWMAFSIVLLDVAIQNFLLNSINHSLRITTGFIAGWTAITFLFSSIEK